MIFFLAIFGLGIALFQSLILIGLYNFNIKPKWIVFLITPLTIIIANLIGEQVALVTVFIHFTSVFILAIIGMVIKSAQADDEPKPKKTTAKEIAIQPNTPAQFMFNPLLGVTYQLYVIIIIFLHIFIPKSDTLNTENLMNSFFEQMYFQVFSIISLLIFSITYLLSKKVYNAQNELLYHRISNVTIKPFFSNKALAGYIIIAGILVFNYFFDIRKNAPVIIQELSNPSIYNLYIGFFAYLLYQIVLIIINPKEATLMNIAKAKTFFKSAHMGIFMGAALVPIFLVIDSQVEYFNMSSEIILFLGFNIVLLVTEIIIYRRMKNSTFTTSKL